jgi:sugar phosphate isomerase/epimerase
VATETPPDPLLGSMKKFGVSTHLYHELKLEKAHLLEIAANGFEAVELFATRSHFDYHDEAAIQVLKDWLTEAKLELHSVHAPITDVFANGRGQRIFSTATRDTEARKAALHEMAAALKVAKVVPFNYLVVHLGVPLAWGNPGPDENNRDAAIRSVEEIHGMAEATGVNVALEVMGNTISTAPDLVEIIERSFEGADIGICMDVGHAHMLGDTTEAIETTSEYLVTTHIHDNRRQSDDHLVPFQGNINWAATIMAFEKIGYDGVLMYEVRAAESPAAVLAKAVGARRRLEALMADSSQLSAFSSQSDSD